jgi:hypothetical protein
MPDVNREMFLLSYASNAGSTCVTNDLKSNVSECVQHEIKRWFSDKDKGLTDWKIVWGPGVYMDPRPRDVKSLNPKYYPANVMLVAYNQATSTYFISVAGTNPESHFDLFKEDLKVSRKVHWPYGGINDPNKRIIAEGSFEGLKKLQDMVPDLADLPKKRLDDFFTDALQNAKGSVNIIAGGHSLGGALAPLVALWLLDTKKNWCTNAAVNPIFSCWRFAAPTMGDKEFLKYYADKKIQTTNVSNSLDVVPLAWNYDDMGRITKIYQPSIDAGSLVTDLVNFERSRVEKMDYIQIGSGTPFTGNLKKELIDAKKTPCQNFTTQMCYQHICGYFDFFHVQPPDICSTISDLAKPLCP